MAGLVGLPRGVNGLMNMWHGHPGFNSPSAMRMINLITFASHLFRIPQYATVVFAVAVAVAVKLILAKAVEKARIEFP